MQKNLSDIRSELQKFNSDVIVSSIREKYNTPYLEIEGIEEIWQSVRSVMHKIAYAADATSYQTIFANDEYASNIINDEDMQDADTKDCFIYFAEADMRSIAEISAAARFASADSAKEASALFNIILRGIQKIARYNVTFNGKPLTTKPVSKSEVAYLIFSEYAKANNATLQQMCQAFPVSINPYYASGKYYQHLFYAYSSTGYMYDGNIPQFGSNVPNISNRDFYSDRNHQYLGITNLKMWRKDAFESLIDHLKNNLPTFASQLSVTDTDGNTIL